MCHSSVRLTPILIGLQNHKNCIAFYQGEVFFINNFRAIVLEDNLDRYRWSDMKRLSRYEKCIREFVFNFLTYCKSIPSTIKATRILYLSYSPFSISCLSDDAATPTWSLIFGEIILKGFGFIFELTEYLTVVFAIDSSDWTTTRHSIGKQEVNDNYPQFLYLQSIRKRNRDTNKLNGIMQYHSGIRKISSM